MTDDFLHFEPTEAEKLLDELGEAKDEIDRLNKQIKELTGANNANH